MITFRREYLDYFLELNIPRMRGKVLDIGGRKNKKRGKFRPPLGQVEAWHYANPDKAAEPDFQSPAESLPVEDSSYDLVIMTEVLEYVGNPNRAILELSRVLRPGGTAFLSVPLHSPVHGDWQFDNFRFTKSGLDLLLRESGFSKITLMEMGGIGAVFFDFLEAATGYANPRERNFSLKVLRKILFAIVPLFRLIDKFFRGTGSFITTGYFITLQK